MNSRYIPMSGKRIKQGHNERRSSGVTVRKHNNLDPDTWKRIVTCRMCGEKNEIMLHSLMRVFSKDFGDSQPPIPLYYFQCSNCGNDVVIKQTKIPKAVKEKVQ